MKDQIVFKGEKITKYIFSRTAQLISTKSGTKHYCVKGTQVVVDKRQFNTLKEDKKNLNLRYGTIIAMCAIYLKLAVLIRCRYSNC